MSRSRTNKTARKKEKKWSKMRTNMIGIYDGFRKNGLYAYHFDHVDSELIGEYFTEPIYKMYRIGENECGITREGHVSVRIEVYRISDALLQKLHKNYGWRSLKYNDNMFNKHIIPSPYGKISIFMYSGNQYDIDEEIFEGDWLEYTAERNRHRDIKTIALARRQEKVYSDLDKIFDR